MTTTTPLHFSYAAAMLKSAFAALTAKSRSVRLSDNVVALERPAAGDHCAATREVRDPFRKV